MFLIHQQSDSTTAFDFFLCYLDPLTSWVLHIYKLPPYPGKHCFIAQKVPNGNYNVSFGVEYKNFYNIILFDEAVVKKFSIVIITTINDYYLALPANREVIRSTFRCWIFSMSLPHPAPNPSVKCGRGRQILSITVAVGVLLPFPLLDIELFFVFQSQLAEWL